MGRKHFQRSTRRYCQHTEVWSEIQRFGYGVMRGFWHTPVSICFIGLSGGVTEGHGNYAPALKNYCRAPLAGKLAGCRARLRRSEFLCLLALLYSLESYACLLFALLTRKCMLWPIASRRGSWASELHTVSEARICT